MEMNTIDDLLNVDLNKQKVVSTNFLSCLTRPDLHAQTEGLTI